METTAKKNITVEQVIALLDTAYYLVHVDYNDNLDNSLEAVQKAIHDGDYQAIYENIQNWVWDTEADAIHDILDELKAAAVSMFDIDEDEAEELINSFEDKLRDAIYDRDKSNTIHQLLKNTGKQVFFYDTGVEVEGYGTTIASRLKEVKKGLKIAQKDKTHDKELSEMVGNASYGGRLVIYFRDDIEDYITIGEDINKIIFSGDVSVAIVNNGNGSGGDCSISATITLPFNKENIFIDKTVKYNYTFAVCGMSSDWCDGTQVSLKKTKSKAKAERSSVNNLIDKEIKLNETFKQGKCTTGDMDTRRHRDLKYINDFPCGTKCPHCSTFWVD